MTKFIYNPLLFWPTPKLLSLFGPSFDYVVKLATNYQYYKEKLGIIELTNKLVTNIATFVFIYDNSSCADLPGLVSKKRELLKTFLYLLSYAFELPFLLFNLTMSKFLVISK